MRVSCEKFHTTDGRGFGVRAIEPIPRGTLVLQYSGELITRKEALLREDRYVTGSYALLFCVPTKAGTPKIPPWATGWVC
jgi:SET domain-containing protein